MSNSVGSSDEYIDEEGYDKVESCKIISSLLEMGDGSIKFTSKLGVDEPAYTSLREEKVYFSANYLQDKRQNSFTKFQSALIHETAHIIDIKSWKAEGVYVTEKFAKIFKFFSEGLASSFDAKDGYIAEKQFMEDFYRENGKTDLDPGKVMENILKEKVITVEEFEEQKDVYNINYRRKEPGKTTEKILEIGSEEAKILGNHYDKALKTTEKTVEKYKEILDQEIGRGIGYKPAYSSSDHG